MAHPNPTTQRSARHLDALVDEMSRESFPASDPPQLTEIRDEPAEQDADVFTAPFDEAEVDPRPLRAASQRVLEETLNVGDQGAITLRRLGDPDRLQIFLGEEGLALAPEDLDALIEVLQRKRADMRR